MALLVVCNQLHIAVLGAHKFGFLFAIHLLCKTICTLQLLCTIRCVDYIGNVRLSQFFLFSLQVSILDLYHLRGNIGLLRLGRLNASTRANLVQREAGKGRCFQSLSWAGKNLNSISFQVGLWWPSQGNEYPVVIIFSEVCSL